MKLAIALDGERLARRHINAWIVCVYSLYPVGPLEDDCGIAFASDACQLDITLIHVNRSALDRHSSAIGNGNPYRLLKCAHRAIPVSQRQILSDFREIPSRRPVSLVIRTRREMHVDICAATDALVQVIAISTRVSVSRDTSGSIGIEVDARNSPIRFQNILRIVKVDVSTASITIEVAFHIHEMAGARIRHKLIVNTRDVQLVRIVRSRTDIEVSNVSVTEAIYVFTRLVEKIDVVAVFAATLVQVIIYNRPAFVSVVIQQAVPLACSLGSDEHHIGDKLLCPRHQRHAHCQNDQQHLRCTRKNRIVHNSFHIRA